MKKHMKKAIASLLIATVATTVIPANIVLASPNISISPYILGPKMMLKGTVDIPYTELRLTIDDSYYLSDISNYNHTFTVRLEGATFNKAGSSYEASDFEKIVHTKEIDDDVTVEIGRFRDDEFTFTIKDGLLKKNDTIIISLDSTLNSMSSSALATVAVYSDFYVMEPESYTSVTERAFYATLDKTVKIVAGETVKLDGKGIKISPVVENSYMAGTAFELGISNGFEFADGTEIKAVDSGNSVTYGKVKNGKIYIEAPSAKDFYIYGISIKADKDVSTGSFAEMQVYSQGMLAMVNSNSSSTQEASEGNRPAEKEEIVVEDEKVEVEVEDDIEIEEDIEDEVVEDDDDIETEEDEKEPLDPSNAFPYTVEIPVGRKVMVVDGKSVEIDVPAYIHTSGYTMLPIRAVADILGDNATVDWDANTKTVNINMLNSNREIAMTVGSSFYTINESTVPIIGVPMEIVDDRAFLPVRPLANALGIIDIDWDENLKIVTLNGSNK